MHGFRNKLAFAATIFCRSRRAASSGWSRGRPSLEMMMMLSMGHCTKEEYD